MVDTVIVALPREDDRVNRIASGRAHLTLMYLGEEFDDSNLESVARYLQHIAKTSMHRFGLSVDRRGKLGDKDADVLFFEDGWDTREIKQVIGYLMADEHLAVAYNQQRQKFPTWIPHLTLGYPDKPAKELKDDDSRYWYVEFDRIAIWTGDSEGPEFPLKKYEYSDMAMSDETALGASFAEYFLREEILEHYGIKDLSWVGRNAEDLDVIHTDLDFEIDDEAGNVLRHYGVKGMQWGKRKAEDDSGSGNQTASAPKSKESRKDYNERVKKEQDEFYQKKLNDIVEKSVKSGEDVLIETRYAGDTYKTITTGKEFVQELSRGRAFDAKVTEIFANKTKEGPYELTGNNTQYQKPKRGEVKHDDFDDIEELFHGEEWFAAYSLDESESLAHYGVKGMRWGVRKADRVPTEVSLTVKPGQKVKAKGGKFESASEDAKKAAIVKQKAKSSSTDSLSNAELKQLIERMQLESNYKRLIQQERGNDIVKRLFSDPKYRNRQIEDLGKLSMPVRTGAGLATAAVGVGATIKKTDLRDIGR